MIKGLYYILYFCRTLFTRPKDPFIRMFVDKVLKPSLSSEDTGIIESYMKKLAVNQELFKSIPIGAGSRFKNKQVTLGATFKRISIRPRYGRILNHMVSSYKPETIIELGTAFGISTTFLATGNKDSRVITVEANPQLCELAGRHFSEIGLRNISLINKPFDEVLQRLATQISGSVLVFIDGNHTFEATMRYYYYFGSLNDEIILVFDDINWSAGMRKAWNKIQQLPESGITIDIFQMGIVFRGKKKMNIVLWY